MKYEDFEYEIINNEVKILKYDGLNTRVFIPDTIDGHVVSVIGEDCFVNNDIMKKLRFPKMLKKIESYAIHDCSALLELHFPNSYLTIESFGIWKCISLKMVTIPQKVQLIYPPAFMGCFKLDTIFVDENNENHMAINDVLFLKNPFWLLKYPEGKIDKRYIVPPVEGIVSCGFAFNQHIKRVLLPKSLTYIRSCGFYGSSIDKLSIPDNVKELGESSFACCNQLEKIVLSKNIKRIESRTFEKCTKLESIVIPKSVRSLDCTAFNDCNDNLVIQVHKQCYLKNRKQLQLNIEIEES